MNISMDGRTWQTDIQWICLSLKGKFHFRRSGVYEDSCFPGCDAVYIPH